MARITAVLDTCVLYPALTRDVLLTMAFYETYFPMWSDEILAELRTNLAKLNPPPDVDRLVANMSKYFPDSLITGHTGLIPSMGCHPKDAHVLAAAVWARATLLVTDNLADFLRPRSSHMDSR